jgi:thioredoxin 1
MKTLPAILLLVLGLAPMAGAEVPAGWSTNYAAALSQAAGEDKPALVFFTASWCGPCKMMSRSTLSEAAVQQALSHFACIAIDIDEQRELASQHGIEAVPTFVLLSAAGDEVQRATGFQAAGDFVPWLKRRCVRPWPGKRWRRRTNFSPRPTPTRQGNARGNFLTFAPGAMRRWCDWPPNG